MEMVDTEKKEKVLGIKLVGHGTVYAYKNKDRKERQPHYKGDGVAVWINERIEKEPEQKVDVEDI